MKKNIKYRIIFLLIIIVIIITFLAIKQNNKHTEDNKENLAMEEKAVIEENKEEEEKPFIIGIEKKEDQVTEPEPEPAKDAATLTQEIYNMNCEIGTLSIPKTGLTTPVYSNVTVDKMEQMPCFLYTTGGLNKTGVTLLVGHNRMNGTLFSNNNKLVEGDEFYFTDYEGTEMKYTIYSKFITTESDISFLNDDVDSPTIALSCCTDANDENRIIILGRVEV